MADIANNIDKINDLEVGANKALTQALMTKFGANINALIDGRLFINSQTFTANGSFIVPEAATIGMIIACAGGGGGGGPIGTTDGSSGGSTIWDDPTNGTLTFRGARGGPGGSTARATLASLNYAALFMADSSVRGDGSGESSGGWGGNNVAGLVGQDGGRSDEFVGGSSGAGAKSSGGGGAGPFGNGGAGSTSAGNGTAASSNSGAGGGGGANGAGSNGGNGAGLIIRLVTLTELDSITVTLGGGGAGGSFAGVSGGSGGSGQLIIFY